MSRAALLVAHGSRLPAPCQAVIALAGRLQQTLAMPVAAAFLECRPDVITTIDRLVAAGATHITVVPYFLHAGRHVQEDLPRLLDEAAHRHPDCHLVPTACLEGDPGLEELLTARLRKLSDL